MAKNEGADPSTRLSSIHALGLYVDQSDKELLTMIASTDANLQYAARAAFQRLENPASR